MTVKYDAKDLGLAKEGIKRITWAEMEMPVLRSIRKRFEKDRPLTGLTLGACLHVTTETANLMITLKAGGANVSLCASNPLSTQDDVVAALVTEYGIPVFAVNGEDANRYYSHIWEVLSTKPQVVMDDGADLISTIHRIESDSWEGVPETLVSKVNSLSREDKEALIKGVIGGTEETTTGVIRLQSMAKEGVLLFPVIAVNDADTKHLFDNRYGTGQSTIDGILRATNRLIAGSHFVVCGYGWCGRGVAMRARGMGARVIVTEVDPIKGLEAVHDGFEVMPLKKAAEIGDFFVTVTGDIRVVAEEHLARMKDGAIIANSGHFNVEIDVEALERMATKKERIKSFVDEYTMSDGRRIYLLGEGRLINLVAAEGHPSAVMDMSFANQALSAEYLFKSGKKLNRQVYKVPLELDREVASLKLEALGIEIDRLTAEQEEYLSSWEIGT